MDKNKETKKAYFSSRNIAWFAVLLALTIVLQLWGSSIKIGSTSLNLSLIPVVLAAIILGPISGGIMGLISSVIILITTITSDPFTMILFQDHPVITVITILLKGTLAGLCSGLVFKLFEKKRTYLGTFIASGIAPIENTLIFIIGALLMSGTLKANFVAEGQTVMYFLVIVCAGINFILEFAVNLILAPAIYTVVKAIRRKDN